MLVHQKVIPKLISLYTRCFSARLAGGVWIQRWRCRGDPWVPLKKVSVPISLGNFNGKNDRKAIKWWFNGG